MGFSSTRCGLHQGWVASAFLAAFWRWSALVLAVSACQVTHEEKPRAFLGVCNNVVDCDTPSRACYTVSFTSALGKGRRGICSFRCECDDQCRFAGHDINCPPSPALMSGLEVSSVYPAVCLPAPPADANAPSICLKTCGSDAECEPEFVCADYAPNGAAPAKVCLPAP